jgi:nickel/cobalt transporter (NicO) family protein
VPFAPTEPLLFTTCAYGLSLGLRHAFDSDHVAAITTMVTAGHRPRQAALVGASWGLGHALAVVGAGAILVALGVQVPPRLAITLELVVVAMLVGLGLWTMLRKSEHGPAHAHAHVSRPGDARRWSLRAAGVGLVHGASGTAALALLVITTLPSRAHGLYFLLIFAAGATLSMTLLSFVLAVPLAAISRRWKHAGLALRLLAGSLSLAAGALLLVEQLHLVRLALELFVSCIRRTVSRCSRHAEHSPTNGSPPSFCSLVALSEGGACG